MAANFVTCSHAPNWMSDTGTTCPKAKTCTVFKISIMLLLMEYYEIKPKHRKYSAIHPCDIWHQPRNTMGHTTLVDKLCCLCAVNTRCNRKCLLMLTVYHLGIRTCCFQFECVLWLNENTSLKAPLRFGVTLSMWRGYAKKSPSLSGFRRIFTFWWGTTSCRQGERYPNSPLWKGWLRSRFPLPALFRVTLGRPCDEADQIQYWHFLRHYEQYIHETWHKGTLWQGPSEHTSLSDLHSRSRWQGLMENLEKVGFFHTLSSLQSCKLAQW